MRPLALSLALALAAGCGPKPVPKPAEPPAEPPAFDWAAYPRVDIVDGAYLVMPADLAQVPGIEATLASAGVPADLIAGVISGSEEAAWPGPFADASQRYDHAAELALMRTRQVAYLDPDWVVVAALVDENQHLEPEVRPQHDLFAVFIEWGVQPIDPVPARPGTKLDADRYDAVKVVDPDRVFPYAGIRYLENAEATLLSAGVPQTALEAVYNRSEELGWPRELRWDRRPANAAAISTYHGRKVAQLGASVLVLIAADENQHMADKLRPTYDFYFLVDGTGVAPL